MKVFLTKKKLSASVGWSETNGRRWVKQFQQYIPCIKEGKKVFYTEESKNVLSTIKKLSEQGLSSSDILEIFKKYGIPNSESELTKLVAKNTSKSLNIYNKDIAETIPTQKEIILPMLSLLKDRKPWTTTMLNQGLAEYFLLNEEQKNVIYPNSKDSIFTHRMRSTRYSLKKQGYIDEVSKFTYQITDDGFELLSDNEHDIHEEIEELEKVIDPFEIIQEKVEDIENELINDLLEHLKQAHWRRLETIVVELMTAMGYGDGEVTEKTNDGGLDGIIKEDKLGLDNIYLQAKKWESSVGRPEVMSFSGALDAKGARKGIFITTSSFTTGAKEYAERLESKKIILIDGRRLAKLMIENNIGVNIKKTVVIKEVDFSYFEGE
ncbi:restriction endonuclease [Cytobacillus firmus]|uniref:restriction endonuclease n=1 Tax=Cytobacillus firmus TaxID=1399 RepID=UPI001C93DA00|nr:restriction endonuclease [Cytobacillus firmus]MBY6054754.1 restriction endonuclease [Cytobacillus firmus]